jgi:hypothetical protein
MRLFTKADENLIDGDTPTLKARYKELFAGFQQRRLGLQPLSTSDADARAGYSVKTNFGWHGGRKQARLIRTKND